MIHPSKSSDIAGDAAWAAETDAAIRKRQRRHLDKVAARVRQEGNKAWFLRSGLISTLAVGDVKLANRLIEEGTEICSSLQKDCTDFFLNLLLRAYLLFPDRITPENRERIRKAATGNRFYGGHRRQYPMFYSSENHHMCWATAEFLTAQCFPEDRFGFDGRSAAEHYARARFLVANWMDRRARWGYCEWNSSCYMGGNLMSLLNLADFAADPEIRRLANQSTTKLLADLAADSLGGGIWGAQARVYEPNVFSANGQSTSAALMLLLGAGDAEGIPPGGGDIEYYATTTYRPPRWLCDLACDVEKPLLNEERHRGEEDLFYDCRSVFWRLPFELSNPDAMLAFAPDSLIDTPVRTERTADTLVSAMLARNANKLGSQALYWMGSLRGKVPIFTTQPFKPEIDQATERYWAGTSSTPVCYLRDGVLAAVYTGGPKSADFTHAHFPTADLSEWTQRGNGFFGRLDEAYVGLLAPKGAALAVEGPWAGRDILAPGRDAVWVAVFGSKRQHGAFADFVEGCLHDRRIDVAPDQASVAYEAGGRKIRVSCDGVEEDGAPFSCADWPQLNNRVLRHDYGSAQTQVLVSGKPEVALDFSSARPICSEWERHD